MDPLNDLVLPVLAVAWVAGFGLTAAQVARRVERLRVVWFVFGAILGPVALVLLLAAPPGRCRTCGSATRGWLRICWWCHEDVRSTPASTMAIVARMSGGIGTRAEPVVVPPPRRPDPPRPFVIRTDPVPSPNSTLVETPSPADPAASPRNWPAPAVAPPAAILRTRPDGDPPPVEGDASRPAPLATAQAKTLERDPGLSQLATAVFVAGSARLVPGHRYSLALRRTRLLVLGPLDTDPSAVVLDRAVGEIEVRAVEGRLVVSEPRSGSGLVLAFMSVAGATTADLAARITEAARAPGPAS